MNITPGIYQHYKGKKYQVYGVCRHSETEELLVVYRCLYGNHDLWVRPYEMFTGNITIDGINRARFKLINKTGSKQEISL